MFRDIFSGKPPKIFRNGLLLENAETLLEMHYITRSGSLEEDLEGEDFQDALEEQVESHWSEDPLSGRLSAVDSALASLPCQLIDKHWQWVTTLDLSRNHIEEPDFIVYFERLETLILDHNIIGDSVVFPRMATVTTLWINFNQIGYLFPFADNLRSSFPKLTYLSMMGNPAAPSFVNDGKFHDYLMYRLYLISKVPSLTYLDDRAIEVDEKKEANIMFTKSAKYPSNHTGLKGAFGDFSHNMSAIEAATNLNSTDDDSLGHKIRQFFEDTVLRRLR